MSYVQYSPTTALESYVDCYWSFGGSRALSFRVLPDGCADILIDRRSGTVRIVGTMSQARVVPACPHQDLIAIRFRPGGARALLHLPMEELTDQWVATTDLQQDTAPLQFLTHSDPSLQSVMSLERNLLALIQGVESQDARALRLASQCSSSTTSNVSQLAVQLGLSRQHLTREIKRATGIGAKDLMRAARLTRVVAHLCAGKTPNASLAHHSGFFDQAHLINAFQSLAGVTPSGFITERFPTSMVRT